MEHSRYQTELAMVGGSYADARTSAVARLARAPTPHVYGPVLTWAPERVARMQ